ncbi:hypothetical protein NMG60_11009296 [Bertholletia excelsa]
MYELTSPKDEQKMSQFVCVFQRHLSRTTVAVRPHVRLRTLVSASTHHQQFFQPPQIDQNLASVHSVYSNPLFRLLGLCRSISSLQKIHALLVVHGLTNDLLFQTKLVSLYGLLGRIESARLVFERISDPDAYSFKTMVRWYFLNELYLELIQFYSRMRKCLREQDDIVLSILLKACTELREINEGRKAHGLIVKVGSSDGFVLTGLIDMYGKCGEVGCSRIVFDEIAHKDVVCWTSMIVGYVQNDYAEEGIVLFSQMKDDQVEGNQYTFGSVVTACSKLGALHQGKWVHGYLIKRGIDLNSFLITALVDLYVKCGAVRDARSVFDMFHTIDLVSWTAMIVRYTQNGYPDEALKLFTDKKWMGILPNTITIASVLSACAQLANLKLGRLVHCLGIKLGLHDHTVINALIDMYAKNHMIADAHNLFETVSDKNLIAWNSIISGYSQNGSSYEALKLFHNMRTEHLLPDEVSIVTVLSACASLGALLVGASLHAYSIKEGLLSSNVYVGTALVNLYAKCGNAESARNVFDRMREKNRITWATMIGGYGIQGDLGGAISLFDNMLKENLEPNDIIFTTILSACSHAGMVGEGLKYFNSMCKQYNFIPSKEQYVCVVDLLARAGRLEDAWNFIETFPIELDVSLFGAFLHGCNLHSRFDLAEVATKKMLELHPDEACYYILLSNMYASGGRWSKANQVRELMMKSGLSKSPGFSQVDMDITSELLLPKVASMA